MNNDGIDIHEVTKNIMANGPTRVLITRQGDAYPSKRAREQYGVEPDIIFIRNDGWSLAAPAYLEREAFDLWPDFWTHFIRKPQRFAHPISEYKR